MKGGISTTLIAMMIVSALPNAAYARYLEADPIGPTRNYSDPLLQVQIRQGMLSPAPAWSARPFRRVNQNGIFGYYQQLNHPYTYVNNNPLRYIDPTGLAPQPATIIDPLAGGGGPTTGVPTGAIVGGAAIVAGQAMYNNRRDAERAKAEDECHDECEEEMCGRDPSAYRLCINTCMKNKGFDTGMGPTY